MHTLNPQTGTGIGLRAPHHREIIARRPDVGFLEAHSENYFRINGIPFTHLMQCREHYPVSLHGVGLSLGSADGVCPDHLQKLKTLVDIVEPALVSEHISWSRFEHTAVPDLLPLPMTDEALGVICANISKVQDTLKRTILAENPSRYISFRGEDWGEPEFLAEIARRTGCSILLDVNNIHVSGQNTGFDALDYIARLPRGIVGEMHLAGFQENTTEQGKVLIDAHNNPVSDAVWGLFRAVLEKFGDTPTLIEWDSDIPALDTLVAEAHKADRIRRDLRLAHAA